MSLTIPAVCDAILLASRKTTLRLEMPLPCPCPIQHQETTGVWPPWQLRPCTGLWDTVDVFEHTSNVLGFASNSRSAKRKPNWRIGSKHFSTSLKRQNFDVLKPRRNKPPRYRTKRVYVTGEHNDGRGNKKQNMVPVIENIGTGSKDFHSWITHNSAAKPDG